MRLPALMAALVFLRWIAAGAEVRAASEASLTLGMSTALTGPLAPIGLEVKRGVEVAIEEINRERRGSGLRWRLLAVDDGYDPRRTAANMRSLIEEHRVSAVVGNLGTPTAAVALPIAMQTRTLFFAPITGAAILRRTPPYRYVVHIRASYRDEIEAMVEALTCHARIGVNEIGFLTQRDAFGDDGFAAGLAAVARRLPAAVGEILHLRYERNTTAVEGAVARLLTHPTPPKAVIMVATHSAGAKFIRLMRERGLDTPILAVSFAGSDSLADSLGRGIDRVMVSQVMPPPSSNGPMAVRYREALRSFGAGALPTYASFEGYVAIQVLARAVEGGTGGTGSDHLVDALERLGVLDLGADLEVRLSPEEHHGIRRVWPTILRDGVFVPCEWGDLAAWGAPAP